jgi:hypothetical protein
MIYEYAVEPSLVVNWAVGSIGRFARQFGLDHRRIVSDFPKDWRGRVVSEFYERFDFDDSSLEFQNAQPSLDAYLQLLTESMVYRDVSLPVDYDWVASAAQEHGRCPFHAIFASRIAAPNEDAFVTETSTEDVRNYRWWLPTVRLTQKSAIEIAAVLRPLLRISNQIVLVDPHFDAGKKRFRDSIAEIARVAAEMPRAVKGLPSITIVTGVDRGAGLTTAAQAQNAAAEIKRQVSLHRHELAPIAVRLYLVVLQQAASGDALHNRFVLTEVGGVIVPYGLDDDDRQPGNPAQDDMTPMYLGQYAARWAQYADLKGVNVVLGPILI